MKVLIEGYSYPPEVVANALPGNRIFLTNNKVPVEYVGYYHNARSTVSANDDFVFFLPKVVLNKDDRVFVSAANPQGFSPEEIVDPDNVQTKDGRKLRPEDRKFLYEFSVWIYRALAYYLETHPDTEAVWYSHDCQSGAFKRKYVANTFLDVILALIRFNRENQDYFLFKVKEKHAGLNKISWPRTIARSQALISDGSPVYLNPINKKRMIDFDEELLVIFYSILNYIHERYKFDVKIVLGYQLIKGDRFTRYLKGYGAARLRQIRYKYFSDRDLTLWELCFAFFDKVYQTNIAPSGENYLLAKNFEIVFEAMVDELLGDPELAKFKDLEDGKEIDHLYVDRSLTRTDDWRMLCIADSKYYKIGNSLERKSRSKQFTYARDMLQLDLDLFLYGTEEPGKTQLLTVKHAKKQEPFSVAKIHLLRDEVTEGYDIIPNFFISATMNEDFDYEHDDLSVMKDENRRYESVHFENRLFDRDTLILSHFSVNFLYLLKLYVQNDSSARKRWKELSRTLFRDEIRSIISAQFDLYAIMPHDGINAQQFFKENFKTLAGRVYAPYPEVVGKKPIYALAIQKHGYIPDDDRLTEDGKDVQSTRVENLNIDIMYLVESAFYIEKDIAWGEDPRPALEKTAAENPVAHLPAADSVSGVQVVSHVSGHLAKAVAVSGWCPCPKDQCKNANTVQILVLPYTQGANLYRVKQGSKIKTCADAAEVATAFPTGAFEKITFPSYPVCFWQVDKIG